MEPAGPEAVLMQGIDYVFVPSVMNTTDVQWIVGKHRAWVQQQKGKIPWECIVPEAYIVLNPNSSVGKVTKAVCDLKAGRGRGICYSRRPLLPFPDYLYRIQRDLWRSGCCESCIGSDR